MIPTLDLAQLADDGRRQAWQAKQEVAHLIQAHLALNVHNQLTDVIRAQLKRNGVELIRGKGTFLDAHRIEVQHLDGSRRLLQSPRVVLATGSRPRHVPAIEVDHEHIVDSDSILSLPYIPRSLLVLGSGVVGWRHGRGSMAVDVTGGPGEDDRAACAGCTPWPGPLPSRPAISQLPGRAAYPSRVARDHYIQAALMRR